MLVFHDNCAVRRGSTANDVFIIIHLDFHSNELYATHIIFQIVEKVIKKYLFECVDGRGKQWPSLEATSIEEYE